MIRKVLSYALSLLIGLPASAAAQQVVPGRNQIYRLDGTAARPSDTYERDQNLGRFRIAADNEGNTANGILQWDWDPSRLKLRPGYELHFNTTAISETDITKIDGITNGAAAASKALVLDANLDISGIRDLTVTRQFIGPVGSVSATAFNFGTAGNGLYQSGGGRVDIANGGVNTFRFEDGFLTMFSNSSVIRMGAAQDANIWRDAANVIAHRNGTNAQGWRLYNTYTDASNYERLNIRWDSNSVYVETGQAGTGNTRPLYVGTSGAASLALMTAFTSRWQVTASGHFLAVGDYNIGDGAGSSPPSIYAETQVSSPAFVFGALGSITASADGKFLARNTAGTGFTMWQLGGTTSSFAALKRNGGDLEARLADDSGYTRFVASRIFSSIGQYDLNTSGTVWIARGTGTPEGAQTASVGSVYVRTDGGAGTTLYVKESGTGNTGWVAK